MTALPLPPLCAEPAFVVGARAPARLHLGFLDPSATLGRRFGSLGLVIEGFETELELGPAPGDEDLLFADSAAGAAELDRVAASLRLLRERCARPQPVMLRLRRVLPAHAGLGSGTQLALAVGSAFVRWHGLSATTPQIASWLGRGQRSGIGIAGFDHGGLLVDGGPGPGGAAAPLIARIEPPAAWRAIVALDPRRRGLSGAQEKAAIAELEPLPRTAAAEICHEVMMRVLPGAAADDFEAFASGVNRIQLVLGAHFAPAQGGSAWTSPAVGALMEWLRARAGNSAAIGQSSWGPTGFAIVPSAAEAAAWVDAAHAAAVVAPEVELRIVALRIRGAAVGELR